MSDADLLEYAGYGRRDAKKADRYSMLAVGAARQTLIQAGLSASERSACSLLLSTMVGGWTTTEPQLNGLHHGLGLDDITPYLASTWFPAAPQGQVSIHLGIHGYAKTLVGDRTVFLQVLDLAYQRLRRGTSAHTLVGATDAPLTPFIERAHRASPATGALPLGEGAACLLLSPSISPDSAEVAFAAVGQSRPYLLATSHRRVRSPSWLASPTPSSPPRGVAAPPRPVFAQRVGDQGGDPAVSRRTLVCVQVSPCSRDRIDVSALVPRALAERGLERGDWHVEQLAFEVDLLSASGAASVLHALAQLSTQDYSDAIILAADGTSLAAAHFSTLP